MANIQGSVGQSLLTPTVYTEYQTNKLATDAVAFMNTTPVQPFFAYVAPTAPHRESGHVDTDGVYTCRDNIETTPTIRADDGDGALANMFEPPQELLYSFDEADVLDKPSWVQSLPRYGPTQAEHDAEVNCTKEVYRSRLESLRAVDDLVAAIKTAGDNAPNGRKTVIFLTSDNGFYLGQHRAQQKELGYEEGIGVPLMVYDPNTPNSCGNRTLSNVVVNTDLAPTILDLAGVPLPAPPYDVDGQSLKQLVEPLDVITCTTPPITRYRFLIEHFEHASQAPYPTFFGMRMRGPPEAMYLEGLPIAPPAEGEYYNLVTDQWQLTSSYPDCGGGPGSCSSYSSTLQSLKDCGKPGYSTCQSLETQP